MPDLAIFGASQIYGGLTLDIQIHKGHGDGNFTKVFEKELPRECILYDSDVDAYPPIDSRRMEWGDFDGDGALDMLVGACDMLVKHVGLDAFTTVALQYSCATTATRCYESPSPADCQQQTVAGRSLTICPQWQIGDYE